MGPVQVDTAIVRPWAYIGLSEDFFSRLASHRQGKPEWRRALLVRSNGVPFGSDDIKYLERRVYDLLVATEEVQIDQRGFLTKIDSDIGVQRAPDRHDRVDTRTDHRVPE